MEREIEIRNGGGENAKWIWSERVQAVVMVGVCINIQLTCHAPHIRKMQFDSLISSVNHHLFVS